MRYRNDCNELCLGMHSMHSMCSLNCARRTLHAIQFASQTWDLQTPTRRKKFRIKSAFGKTNKLLTSNTSCWQIYEWQCCQSFFVPIPLALGQIPAPSENKYMHSHFYCRSDGWIAPHWENVIPNWIDKRVRLLPKTARTKHRQMLESVNSVFSVSSQCLFKI